MKHDRHNSAMMQNIEFERGKQHDKIKSKRLTGSLGPSEIRELSTRIHEDLLSRNIVHKCDDLPRISTPLEMALFNLVLRHLCIVA